MYGLTSTGRGWLRRGEPASANGEVRRRFSGPGLARILAFPLDAVTTRVDGGVMTNEDLKAKMREALDRKNTKEKGVHQDGPSPRRRTAPR